MRLSPLLTKALDHLERDNSQLYSTLGLSILLDEVENLIIRKIPPSIYPSLANSEVFGWLMDHELKDLDLYQRIILTPSESGNTLLFKTVSTFYEPIKLNLEKVQRAFNISGLVQKSDNIRGVALTCADVCKLALLDSDREILLNQVPHLLKYFIDLVRLPDSYALAEVWQEDHIPCTYSKIQETPGVYACITAVGYPDKPDQIELLIAQNWNEEDNDVYYDNTLDFVATRRST